RFVHRVDDGLAIMPDFVDVLIQVEDPPQGLLRWRDIVAVGTEYDDRRADFSDIDYLAIRGFDAACGQIVADEQFVNDELYFLGVEIDVAAPPALEFEIAVRFGVH